MMKSFSKVLVMAAFALVLVGCGNNLSKDQQQLCGGYTQQRELTEDEMAMFRSATETVDMTLTPLSVSTQVVAGTNYKFWCRYQDKDDSGHTWVIIFKPLPGRGEPEVTGLVLQTMWPVHTTCSSFLTVSILSVHTIVTSAVLSVS